MPSKLHASRTRKWILSIPPVEWASTQLKELFINSVRQGPVPQHVAFVMDGNRRFARENRIETVEGHNMGFETMEGHNMGFEALAKVAHASFSRVPPHDS